MKAIMDQYPISFNLNGRDHNLQMRPSMLLIDLIRETLGLKGTKAGCLEGECGACTVLIDGVAVNSCLVLVVNIQGKKITTIEGMGEPGKLDEIQESMVVKGAVQCGFCAPGMVMSMRSFIDKCKSKGLIPGREEIKKNLEGNLCRCTGYTKLVDAAEHVLSKAK